MPFVNRRSELEAIDRLAAAISRGRAERHVAILGVRRLGKSYLLDHYVATRADALAALVQVDAAATTPQALLVGVVRATVDALRRHAGHPHLSKIASPIEIATASGALGSDLSTLVERALTRASVRRADARELLAAAVTFPEDIAAAVDRAILVFADEFQHICDLAAYAPFDGGRRRSMEEAQQDVLQVIRAHVERQPRVGWVVTGSVVRLMQRILRNGALMGRFDEYLLGPFDDLDTAELAFAVWDEEGVEPTDAAINRAFRLTQGHPFYTDVVCRRAAVAALRLGRLVSASMVDGAFVDAVRGPTGAIGIACREMYDSLTRRAPNLREVLHVLARREPATVAEIAETAQLASPALAYRHARDLAEMGILHEEPERTYRFVDPVFRYWVAVAHDPLGPEPILLNPEVARRAVRVYEEAYLREREVHGVLQEGDLRDLCRAFAGQSVDGRRFGMPGRHIKLPRVTSVQRIVALDQDGRVLGKPAEIELDLSFGDDVVWLAEVRRRVGRASAADVALAGAKAAFLRDAHGLADGPTWFISIGGFADGARERARELGVYTADSRDVEAIRNEVATRRE